MKKPLLVLLAGLLVACQAGGTLTVTEPWTYPGSAGGNLAVYLTVDNPGADDVLLSAASDIAEAVELHQTVMMDDMADMQMMEQVSIPGNDEIAFESGGLHIMLIGLKQDLTPGDGFSLTLTFENAGEIAAQVEVRQP